MQAFIAEQITEWDIAIIVIHIHGVNGFLFFLHNTNISKKCLNCFSAVFTTYHIPYYLHNISELLWWHQSNNQVGLIMRIMYSFVTMFKK